jgi:hypothetical protein
MSGGFSDATITGEDVLSLDLLNRGVGPAHQESLRVTVDGRPVASLNELISVSLGPEHSAEAKQSLHAVHNRVRTRFIPGGQTQFVFRAPKTAENAQLYELLVKQQNRWDLQLCYCSVFQECWQVLGKWQEPTHIEKCRRDESREFMP